MLTIFVFILGLIFGSFFNVVGLRVPKKESIVWPGSHCSGCGHSLTAMELIPVLSYIVQRGRCRHCQERISPIYPIMEFVTAGLFVIAYHQFGLGLELLVALTLISLLVIISVSDLAYMLIPDKILLTFAAVFIIERLFVPLQPWWDALLGAVVGFLLLLIIAIVSKGGMGGGDVKLFAVLGFVLGTKYVLLTFFLATFIGTIFGVGGLLTRKLSRKKPIPFGPFIAIASVLTYFWGAEMIDWYIHIFVY